MYLPAKANSLFVQTAGTGRLVRIEGKMNAAMYQDILDGNLLQITLDLSPGWRFIYQQDNYPKHTAKITKEWLRDNPVNVLKWPSQSPDLNTIEDLRRDLKMAVHWRSSSNLMELERSCKEEWEKLTKNGCAKIVESFSKRLEANCCQRCFKYWAKALNTHVHIIMLLFFADLLQISKKLVSCYCLELRKELIESILE